MLEPLVVHLVDFILSAGKSLLQLFDGGGLAFEITSEHLSSGYARAEDMTDLVYDRFDRPASDMDLFDRI